jgi:hypothetical protein
LPRRYTFSLGNDMESNSLQGMILIIIVWILVPLIFLGLFMLSRSIVVKAKKGEHQLSTRAGFWAGLIAFSIFLIYELPYIKYPDFTSVSSINIYFWVVILSSVVGYFFLFFLKLTIPTRIAGFVVLFFVFCSLSALFSHYFIQFINDVLMSLSLGLAFGVLVHIIIVPKMINDIFIIEEPKQNISVTSENKNV